MAQCGGCCSGPACNNYGPVFEPSLDNVADNDDMKFGTLIKLI